MAFERTEGSRPARPMRRGRKKVCSFCVDRIGASSKVDEGPPISPACLIPLASEVYPYNILKADFNPE